MPEKDARAAARPIQQVEGTKSGTVSWKRFAQICFSREGSLANSN
jgi:hypothetical protein